jgi:hypothetical protein
MNNVLIQLEEHLSIVNHYDDSFQIIHRLKNLTKTFDLPSMTEDYKEVESKNENFDEKIIDFTAGEKNCRMLEGSLLHRDKYFEKMKTTWSLPKLFQDAHKRLPSEVNFLMFYSKNKFSLF